jgi:hypothetical protein
MPFDLPTPVACVLACGGANKGLKIVVRGSASGRTSPSRLQHLALPVGQNSQASVNPFRRKYSTLPKFGIAYIARTPAQGRGAIAIVTNAGRAAVDVGHIGAKVIAGRRAVSDGVARTTGVIRVRQNRVVLAPGVCAPSLVVMCAARPGARVSHPQGDGGNSASLPGESTTYAVPTTAQGRPGCPGYTCMPLCRFITATSHSGPRVPAGSRSTLRPLSCEGEATKQSSGEMSREDAKVCLPELECCGGRLPITVTLRCSPLRRASKGDGPAASWPFILRGSPYGASHRTSRTSG